MPWIHRPKANQCAPLHLSAKLFNWPTTCVVQPRGGGVGGHSRKGLVEVCRRCLQTLTQRLRLRMTEKHTFLTTSQKKSNETADRRNLIDTIKFNFDS